VPALARAQKVIPQHLSTKPAVRGGSRALAISKMPCPQCQQPMSKVPSAKVQRKYFLKCMSGCENVVLFYSKFSKKWEPPRAGASEDVNAKTGVCLSEYACPVCKKPMEEYTYQKDGQVKKLLRCSDPKARSQAKHKDAVYFHTETGWWSPKHGKISVFSSKP
jgi:DNA topoisomerase I